MRTVSYALFENTEHHAAPVGHPERADKLSDVVRWLREDRPERLVPFRSERTEPVSPLLVHTPAYLEHVQATVAGGGWIDQDTYTTPASLFAYQTIIDTLCTAIDLACSGGSACSMVIGRPPGHHAESKKGMGFCLLNPIAVAAQYAISRTSAKRIAIVDFDVHHGNGTQEIFYDRSDILFASIHQYPFYPGTGHPLETGHGAGEDLTVNCPVPAGAGDEQFLAAFMQKIVPAVRSFSPDLILVSAGFDGHHLDPLVGLHLTGDSYFELGTHLHDLADQCCMGRIVSTLEGGYSPAGLADGLQHYLKGLAV